MPSTNWNNGAALLAAVALHADGCCDIEVPLHCAGAVAALGGTATTRIPSLRDTQADIASSVEAAVALLDDAAFDDELSAEELDALAIARAHVQRAWRVLDR